MGYVLDTNVVSNLIRDPNGRVARRVRDAGESNVCTSIIVAAELRFGAAKSGSAQLGTKVEGVLARLEILPFEAPADAVYARIRSYLERRGQMIGSNDLLIAAQTVALGHTIVTDNEREFARIAELPVENWLR
jgi:tRNA(fMet)-specific endonuclease VapC